MIEQIKSIKDTVYDLLVEDPRCRNNDNYLMLRVWAKQDSRIKSEKLDFRTFALEFINGIYACPESIRRSRQWIQQHYKELRGRVYVKRQEEEPKVRQGILEL